MYMLGDIWDILCAIDVHTPHRPQTMPAVDQRSISGVVTWAGWCLGALSIVRAGEFSHGDRFYVSP